MLLTLSRSCSLALIGLTLLAGCSSRDTAAADSDRANLANIANFYVRYRGRHRGQPPPDLQTFRDFIFQEGDEVLRTMGVRSIDALFLSTRDGKPYVLLFGKQAVKTPEGQAIVGYEQEGKNGHRLVVLEGGFVEELPAAEFRKSVPGA